MDRENAWTSLNCILFYDIQWFNSVKSLNTNILTDMFILVDHVQELTTVIVTANNT